MAWMIGWLLDFSFSASLLQSYLTPGGKATLQLADSWCRMEIKLSWRLIDCGGRNMLIHVEFRLLIHTQTTGRATAAFSSSVPSSYLAGTNMSILLCFEEVSQDWPLTKSIPSLWNIVAISAWAVWQSEIRVAQKVIRLLSLLAY